MDFIWDGLPKTILYLPVAKEGQGVIDLVDSVAAFYLQALQRLLYCEDSLPWQQLANLFLHWVGGLGFDWELFLLDPTLLDWVVLLPFY